MVAEALVREPLTPEMITAGGVLGRALEGQLRLVACFWYYLPESNAWRLHFATPMYLAEGPLATYRRIQKTLQSLQPERQGDSIDLMETTVIADQDRLVQLIRMALSTERRVASDVREQGFRSFDQGLRLRSRFVDGQYLEEAYVYLVLPPLPKEQREREAGAERTSLANGAGSIAKRAKAKK